MGDRVKSIEKTLLIAIFTTFMGQIYISPFGSTFRLTMAVMVLNVLMLTFLDIKPVATINLVGLLMFLVRSFVLVFAEGATFFEAFSMYYQVIFFYIFYSLFFVALDVRSLIRTPLSLFLAIWICDSIPNLVEFLIRGEWQHTNFEQAVYVIVIIGLIRTFITVVLIYVSRYYYGYVKERDQHQKFVEKIMLMSNLKTELFFLRKSKNDIEEAMKRSYEIYEKIDREDLKSDLLGVTKDIHEIKKDYSRVIAGMAKSVDETPLFNMNLKEILKIVQEANLKNATMKGKKVEIQTILKNDFKTTDFYALISVLNNIIVNAIDAISETGRIVIEEKIEDQMIYFTIRDNGNGIDPSELGIIFEPGYSTKFNEHTGIMASGIGLTHVKQLVEGYFGGKIEVFSKWNSGTTFHIWIPAPKIVETHEVKDEDESR